MKVPSIPCNVYTSLAESLNSPLSPFLFARHKHYCYHFNKEFSKLQYDATLYQASQEYSSRSQSHYLNVASFVKRFASPDNRIVEIGCGKGGFFDVLSRQGFLNLSGFDTTYEGNDSRIKKRYVSHLDTGLSADMIILRHTLEHIPSPFDFLRSIFEINSNKNTSIIIEVPCFDWIVKHQAWWDLTYEHCNYFSEESFRRFFPGAIVEKVFDDQYLLVKADSADLIERVKIPSKTYDDIKIESLFSFFKTRHASIKDLEFWKESQSQGRYWIWGCATKGVLLLFHMKESFSDYYSPVGCIDDNPGRQSKYLPSLGYKIMNAEFLYRNIQDGDTIIVPNPAYLAEINSRLISNTDKRFNLVSI